MAPYSGTINSNSGGSVPAENTDESGSDVQFGSTGKSKPALPPKPPVPSKPRPPPRQKGDPLASSTESLNTAGLTSNTQPPQTSSSSIIQGSGNRQQGSVIGNRIQSLNGNNRPQQSYRFVRLSLFMFYYDFIGISLIYINFLYIVV